MTNTTDLIAQLSHEATPAAPLQKPAALALRLIGILAAYAVGSQIYHGLRPDLALQFTRPLYVLEVLLLAAIGVSSAVACVIVMVPDAYQKTAWLKLPYILFAAFVLLIALQLGMPPDHRMATPVNPHGIECTLCIASVALIPSGFIFSLLRKGASVHPLQAGSFAVLAASSIGCLTLRLAEANDSLAHLVMWHYLPTLLFAILGALAGKAMLRW